MAIFLFIRNKQRQANINPYEQKLIKKFHGDHDKAQRLINAELTPPNDQKKKAAKKSAKNALESLLRDKR